MTSPAAQHRPRVGWFSRRLWGLHVLVVLAVAFTVAMGLWQMGVYDDRRDAAHADHRTAAPVPLSDMLGPDEPFTGTANYRTVTFDGTYGTTAEQVWVTGRDQGGRTGSWLVAPVLVDGASDTTSGKAPALLVVRGWQPGEPPATFPAVPRGTVRIEAVLQPGDSRGTFGFDPDTRTSDALRVPQLVNEMPYDLYSGFGIVTSQQPPDPAALTAAEVPTEQVDTTAGLRNLFYAFEWWVFGGFAILMWWRMCRDIRQDGGAVAREPRVPAARRAAREAVLARRAAQEQEGRDDPERSPSSSSR